MELKVQEVILPNNIEFNYEELKQELIEKVEMYKTLVYTDTEIKQAKSDKANLNKLKKALNDERIRREKEYMKPFNEFKAKINEIIAIIDEPILVIDTQVKEFEEKRKSEKQNEINAIFETLDKQDWLQLESIFNEKWLNASVSTKHITDEMQERIKQINSDLNTLEALTEFSFEAIDEYKRTLDLNRAIAEGKRLSDLQKAKQEAEERAKQGEAAKIDVPVVQEEVEEQKEGQWINFSAFLTIPQALALKEFFNSNNIEFKQI